MLEVREIVKKYDHEPLLRGISFSLAQGEILCLLGASGSGKSTLLRIIAGLELPASGQILLNGIDLAPTPTHMRDFGLVFQDYGLFPHLNVFENLAFGLKLRHLPASEINRRVTELLQQVNLNGFEKRQVSGLSGGEQQRVALARALAPQPRLLMFDEPLGALDRSLKEDLLLGLRAILRRTRIPTLYVTHDQEEAFTIADRILLMHQGRILRADSPAEIWSNPGSAWAARFLNVGNIILAQVLNVDMQRSKMNLSTSFGPLEITCDHLHQAGDHVSLLLMEISPGMPESYTASLDLQLRVVDVLFKRDRYQVVGEPLVSPPASSLIISLPTAPAIGQVISIKFQVRCLA